MTNAMMDANVGSELGGTKWPPTPLVTTTGAMKRSACSWVCALEMTGSLAPMYTSAWTWPNGLCLVILSSRPR